MIYETITTIKKNPLVAKSRIVREAIEFASTVTIEHELGRFDLRGDDFYALMQYRETSHRSERKEPEAHREYVDLQYCYGGGEIIDWYANDNLNPTMEYNVEDDYQLYERPAGNHVPLIMKPGSFALFFPCDAHVPAILDGVHKYSRMVVFKIRLSEFKKEIESFQRAQF